MNFQTRRKEELELNITPLIDVVFLLLIFFMVSTTFQRETELSVQLPEAASDETAEVQDVIEIVINPSGRYYLNGRELVNNQLLTLRSLS